MFRIPCTVAFLVVATAAFADEVPRFDVEAICRSAPRLEPTDPNPVQSCVRDETEARNQLERQWASFSESQRNECVRETNVAGYPSYVDVLTCIQMAAGMPASLSRWLKQPL